MSTESSQLFLKSFGWDDTFAQCFSEDPKSNVIPGRIISQAKGHYHVQIGFDLSVEASITSQLRNAVKSPLDYPGVGDWVVLSPLDGSQKAIIQRVLTRKNQLQRKRGGASTEPQLLVTNVDHVFIVTSLNEDFDIDRLGRYLAIGQESGAQTVLILTKKDICKNPQDYVDQLTTAFGKVAIYKTSSDDTASLDQLQRYFETGRTTVLLGSSGVGKSTLTNYLLGVDAQKTQDLSGDIRGRHTTTSRNLLVTRWGGLVIDTPGMQEVSTFESVDVVQEVFADVEDLMLKCKFTNCRHGADPGCAIVKGIKTGDLSQERWNSYLKLKR